MRKFLFVAAFAAAFLLVAAALVLKAQSLLAFPYIPPGAQKPGALELANGESVWLEVDGKRVEAWFLPAHRPGPAPLVINTHGNGELIDQWAERVTPLRDAGVGVLLVEYPGYGRSEGKPSEKSITGTMLAAYDWAVRNPRIDARRIVVHGRSMGGGAAGQLASRRPLAAVVLESTFTSLAAMVRAHGVPDFLVANRFDTLEALAAYRGPLLILHGARDLAIPVSHARALARAFPQARLLIENCGHNDCPPQWELLLGFLAENGVFSGAATGDSP